MSVLAKIGAGLRKVGRWVVRIAATLIILLALLVGLARLLLPEAAEFKEDIRAAVTRTTGFSIDFDLISAGVSVYGPELRFSSTTISWPDNSELVTVDTLAVSLDLLTWITSGRLVPGRIYIEGTSLNINVAEDGTWILQGHPWSDYVPSDSAGSIEDIPESRLQLADIAFSFRNLQHNGPQIDGEINQLDAVLDDQIIEVSADADPGSSFGRTLEVEASLPLKLLVPDQHVATGTSWNLRLYADDFRLYKWLDIAELRDLPIVDSEGSAEITIDFQGINPQRIAAELELESVQLVQPGGIPVAIDALDGGLSWEVREGGWEAVGKGLRIFRDSRSWPDSNFRILYLADPGGKRREISANASFVRVDDLLPLLQAIVPEQLKATGFVGEVAGDLEDTSLELLLIDGKPELFKLESGFSDLGYAEPKQGFDISGFSGRIAADNDGGNLEINTRDARFGVERLFRDVLDISVLQGLAIWRSGPQGHRLLADGIRLETPEGASNASLELSFDPDLANPRIDLTADASLNDVGAAWRYLPRVLPEKVLGWLDAALIAGRVPKADIRLQGPLGAFPFDNSAGDNADGDNDAGIFLIEADFTEGVLNYAPEWPLLENASGRLVFDGVSMYSTENNFSSSGIELQNMETRIADLRAGVIELSGAGNLRVENLLAYLQQSPVAKKLGPVFADIEATGDAAGIARLKLPIKALDKWELQGDLTVSNAELWLAGIDQHFSDLNGAASIANTRVSAEQINGSFLGVPVTIGIEPVSDPASAYSHRAFVDGRVPVSAVQEAFGFPVLSSIFTGDAAIQAQAMFPGGQGGAAPFSLFLRSDLSGMRSRLPYPLGKTALDADGLQIELQFPETGITQIYGSLNRGLSWAVEASNDGQHWSLTRGMINRAVEIPELPAEPGLVVNGSIDSVDLNKWVSFMTATAESVEGGGAANDWQSLFRSASLQIGELYAIGHRFVDVDADVLFGDSAWDVSLRGPWTEGHMVVPYDFTRIQPLTLDMERLLLIEPQEGDDDKSDTQIDPRALPAIKGTITDFALGNLRLGALDADIQRVADGLKSNWLRTESGSFKTDTSYDWLVVENAQRSRLHMILRSTDVAETLEKLGYSPLIDARKGAVTVDLLWEGGPGMSVLYGSTGTIDLSIRDGAVMDVDAGGGRILGLLSITRLPQRLTLDFTDMTDEGLDFDKISGKFSIDFGNAWTCSLGLEGPVADMGVVGRTGILAQDYDQVAAIRPHVSNLAPVAGAFLAGPTVGVVALLITQIMKKPLSSIGESYYTILGGWDEPKFTKVDRDDLDTRPFADCEKQLPTLSPEEIQAIEDLIANPQALQQSEEPQAAPPTDALPTSIAPAATGETVPSDPGVPAAN